MTTAKRLHDYAMSRKVLVDKAVLHLLDGMELHTRQNGEMTALEWMEALATAERRFRQDALRDEWDEGAGEDE